MYTCPEGLLHISSCCAVPSMGECTSLKTVRDLNLLEYGIEKSNPFLRV